MNMGAWRRARPVDPVGDGAVDDAGTDGRRESGGGSGVDELAGHVLAWESGPLEKSADVVGEGG